MSEQLQSLLNLHSRILYLKAVADGIPSEEPDKAAFQAQARTLQREVEGFLAVEAYKAAK